MRKSNCVKVWVNELLVNGWKMPEKLNYKVNNDKINKDRFPNQFKNNYMKSWSQKCDLKASAKFVFLQRSHKISR